MYSCNTRALYLALKIPFWPASGPALLRGSPLLLRGVEQVK